MIASELIEKLHKMIKEVGDLEVYIQNDDEGFGYVDHLRLVHLLNLRLTTITDVIGICGPDA